MKMVTTRFSLKKVVDLCFGKSGMLTKGVRDTLCDLFLGWKKLEPGYPPQPAPETRV